MISRFLYQTRGTPNKQLGHKEGRLRSLGARRKGREDREEEESRVVHSRGEEKNNRKRKSRGKRVRGDERSLEKKKR